MHLNSVIVCILYALFNQFWDAMKKGHSTNNFCFAQVKLKYCTVSLKNILDTSINTLNFASIKCLSDKIKHIKDKIQVWKKFYVNFAVIF